MWARSLRLAQPVLGPAGDHLDLVVDVAAAAPARRLSVRGTPSTSATMLTREVRLQRRVLVEVVEDDEGGRVALQSR